MPETEPRRALVVSGEGARGSIQASIISNLDVDFLHVYGVSSGAINAAAMHYLGKKDMLQVWKPVKGLQSILNPNWFSWPWKRGLCEMDPIVRMIANISDKSDKTHTFATVYRTKWSNGHTTRVDSTAHTFLEALRDAVTIPGLMSPKGSYFDAGCRMLAPLSGPIKDGYNDIHVVLGRNLNMPAWEPKFPQFATFGYRFIDIMLHEILMRDIRLCIHRNGEHGYKKIKVTVHFPRKTYFDSLEFSRTPEGFDLGKEFYSRIVT